MSTLSVVLTISNVSLYHIEEDVGIPASICYLTKLLMKVCRANRWKKLRRSETQTDSVAQKSGSIFVSHKIYPDPIAFTHGSLTTSIANKTEHLPEKNSSEMVFKDGGGIVALLADEQEVEITWKLVAAVLDAVYLRFYAFCFVTLTIVFMTILSLGDSS
ncbi:hypothetical protein PoB_002641300 [Plakobranchus ocellatus]|uniref:Neurotransmitter-gated ion-channel transmembrane domain-containing protein n=1 Tax=Plakobranchus ocellatus TaxID=259542 RepID=A0AAV3ZZU5_9GAST|nr:hypothetical protein PoB_002641300 [Plakobranchus ocellatus]